MDSNLKPDGDRPPTPVHGPTVHYPDDIPAPKQTKQDSEDCFPSRPSSAMATDEEGEDDAYDWSAEEDLVEEEANFEHRMGIKMKRQGRGCHRIITWFFSTLIGSTLLAALLAIGPTFLHIFYYAPDKSPHRQYVTDNVEAWLFWAAANLLISWYLALFVNMVPHVARFILSVTWGQVSESIQTRTELYNSAKDSIKPIFYAASAWVSWVIIFENIYQLYSMNDTAQSRASYTPRMYQVIEFFFFLTLVICIQQIASHMIAFSFHRAAYKERIDTVNAMLKVLERLSAYRPKAHFTHSKHHPRSSSALFALTPPLISRRNTGDFFDTSDADDEWKKTRRGRERDSRRTSWLHALNLGSASHPASLEASPIRATPSPLPISPNHGYPPTPSARSPLFSRRQTFDDDNEKTEVKGEGVPILTAAAKALKTAMMHDARNIQGKDVVEVSDGLGWNITSAYEARRLARSLYTLFKTDKRRNYLVASDFKPAFDTPAEVEAAFKQFDTDSNGDVSRGEFKDAVIKVYKERRFLSRSLRDVGDAIKTLDSILLLLAFVVLVFISLSVFEVNVGTSLTSMYTLGIAASFVFKNAASNAFDAIVFLFVTHPFDTGDRCFIDDDNLIVKKMGLFATSFTKADGTDTYYFNSQLFLKFITNVRRSGKMGESCTLQVAWRTPLEKLDALENCMNGWLATEENRWFEPSTSVVLQNIAYQRHLEITLGIGHNGTWQDWGLRNARKTAFHAAVNYYCHQLGITAAEAPIPIVYADRETERFSPSTSPAAVQDSPCFSSAADVDVKDVKEMKPVLGFRLPHQQHSKLTRVRKSKRKQAALHAQGVDGGDF